MNNRYLSAFSHSYFFRMIGGKKNIKGILMKNGIFPPSLQ